MDQHDVRDMDPTQDVLDALEQLPDGQVGLILRAYQERRKARDIDWEAANYGWPTAEERARTGPDEILFAFPDIPLSRAFLEMLAGLQAHHIELLRESTEPWSNVDGIAISAPFLACLRSLSVERIVHVRRWYDGYRAGEAEPAAPIHTDEDIRYKIVHARMIAHLFLAWMHENPEGMESESGHGKPHLCVQEKDGTWQPYQWSDRDRIVAEFIEYCQQD